MSDMRRWGIFTAIAVIVILAAGWLLLIKPQKSKVSDLQSQATAQLQANQLLLTQISALQAEQKELPQQQQRLQKFSTQVPNDPAEPTLIRQFSTAAHGSGVDLSSITPSAGVAVAAPASAATLAGGSTQAGSLYELPLTISVSGSYSNVESFFETVEKLPRAVLTTGFNIGPGSSAVSGVTHELTASLTLDVFYTPVTPTAAPSQSQSLTPSTAPTAPATTPATAPSDATAPTDASTAPATS
jgi:type IV pilus assembly protein PilO